jgi:phage replication-related protein YjqB (UPF0714/DUF867 family)
VADDYRSFRELEEAESEGEDWARHREDRGSRILVMAPHGGWIEPLTTELARAVAGREFSFYSFLGIKEEGNTRLHITSHRFDEPVALEAAAEADQVLAIHGERTRNRAFVMVGGGCDRLRTALAQALVEAGFPVREPREGLDGRHRRNICNRGRLGAGGQLELSEGLRARFRREPGLQAEFVRAVRSVLEPLEERLREEGSGLSRGGQDVGGPATRGLSYGRSHDP